MQPSSDCISGKRRMEFGIIAENCCLKDALTGELCPICPFLALVFSMFGVTIKKTRHQKYEQTGVKMKPVSAATMWARALIVFGMVVIISGCAALATAKQQSYRVSQLPGKNRTVARHDIPCCALAGCVACRCAIGRNRIPAPAGDQPADGFHPAL